MVGWSRVREDRVVVLGVKEGRRFWGYNKEFYFFLR